MLAPFPPHQSPNSVRDVSGKAAAPSLTASLRSEIDHVLTSLLHEGARVALSNFPHHRNPGDAAIWLGEREALERLGAQVVYTATASSYRRTRLANLLGDGTILLHGGGSLGDLYPSGQSATRIEILQDFPGTLDWSIRLSSKSKPPRKVRALYSLNQRLAERMSADHNAADPYWWLLGRSFNPLALHWVNRGCRLLSPGRAVVTDIVDRRVADIVRSLLRMSDSR